MTAKLSIAIISLCDPDDDMYKKQLEAAQRRFQEVA